MSTPMFPSHARAGTQNQICAGTPLTPAGIMSIVQRIAQRAGLDPKHADLAKLRPHDLRRSFCQLAKQGGADMDEIKHAMGHASMVTTERYLSQIPDLRLGYTAPDRIKIQNPNSNRRKAIV